MDGHRAAGVGGVLVNWDRDKDVVWGLIVGAALATSFWWAFQLL